MKDMNILLTSVGRRSYLVDYFKNALCGKGKVFVANSTAQNPSFRVADGSVVTPLIYDNDYIPFLIKYCKENNISVIISLFDIDLPILAKNKELFSKNGIKVIVSDYNVVEICNDKFLTYKFLVDNGFNAPKTYLDIENAKKDIDSAMINYPLFVKPRWGMGSISVFEANNEEELYVFYKKVRRELQNSYLKYESVIDIENAVLIQEKLNGQEYGLDIINNLEGDYQNTIVKKKLSMRSGETDCAITVNNQSLKELGKAIGKTLGHIANLDVDVFVVDGVPYVLEMNARFGGGYPFSHMAGVDLPKVIVEWLEGVNDINALFAKSGIMCQKDISLVYLTPNLELRKIKNEELNHSLEKLQFDIVPTLQDRNINIKEYSKKLSNYGVSIAAYIDNDVLGIISGYLNKKVGYISIFIVGKDYQGINVGKSLLKEFEKEAKDLNVEALKLEVRKNNKSAIGFYEHFGFNIISDASDESYYMEKKL